jgi:hypothetical protein
MSDLPYDPSEGILADLKRRFTGFPVPEGLFNPLTATPDMLRKFGLPPKPDADRQPLLRQAWDTGFGKPLLLQQFEVEADLVEQTDYRPLSRRVAEISFDGINVETSSNWSGAYITANHDKQFLQVWGMWTIPGNLKEPAPHLQGPPDLPYVCANWIGLDGQRLYFDSSLPQIGTVSQLAPGAPATTAQAWAQWWAKDNVATNRPVPLGLSVSPLDKVLCVITAWNPTNVRCVMVNLTPDPPICKAVRVLSPTVQLPDGAQAEPSIAGATAEWILERPRVPPTQPGEATPIYNFPDYGESEFDLCLAVEGDGVDIFSLFDGVPQHLRGARRIRMFQPLANPARTEYISVPRKLSESSFHLRHR